VYDSLKAQTFRNFEWLIVDDGSIDNTKPMVENWQKEADFPIRYYWQENQGKHVAFNRGVQLARGELFLSLDSDDACVPAALERFMHHWESVPQHRRDEFCGVEVLCMNPEGELVGDKFPAGIIESDFVEIFYRFKVRGEKWWMMRTDVVKRHPFPEIPGVRYVPEGVVWNAIAREYKVRLANERLRIYWVPGRGPENQLTRPHDFSGLAPGSALYHSCVLNDQMRWIWTAPLQLLASAVHYARFSFHAGVRVREQLNRLQNLLAKLLWVLALPLGYFVYLKDRKWMQS
jgi:glycosyltransferase involved in cell wall biosynthesis